MEPSLRFADVLRVIRARRNVVILMLAVALAAAVLNSLITTPIYQSKITLELLQPSGYVIRADVLSSIGGSGRTTPRSVAELVRSDPYTELTKAVVRLCDGYGIDLYSRRTTFDMVALFERDLFEYPLPRYTGYLVLHRRSAKALDPGEPSGTDSWKPVPSPRELRPRDLSSFQKDEAIKYAGALAALAAREGIPIFRMSEEEIDRAVAGIMQKPWVKKLPRSPLKERSWSDVPLGERGVTIEAVYRLARKYKPMANDLREAKERVDASDIKDTSMVVVRYEASDPQRAQLCADAVASVVVWKDQYARKEEAQLLRQFVEERLSELKEEEQLLDRQQMAFKTSSKTVDLTAEAKGRIDRISELQKQLLQADYAMKESYKRLSAFRARLSEFPKTEVSPTRAENPQIGRLREELYQAEALLQSARATYTDVHPTVRSLQAKRDELAKALKDEMVRQAMSVTTTETSNPVRAEIDKVLVSEQANIVALEARKRALSDALDKEEREISRLPVKERELVRLARDAKVCEVKREFLEQRLMDARINEATKLSSVRVVELALEPGKKVRPKRVLNLALGLVLGIMLGVGAAFAMEAMDRSVRTRRQVWEILQAPVLTCVPQRLDGAADGTVSEAFRSLRLGIMQNGGREPVRSVLLSPVGADAGTADDVISGLAASLAASGLSVVVVDADFRAPRLHSVYRVPESPGLAEALAGESRLEDSFHQTENPRIKVVSAGRVSDAVDALASPAMERVVSSLRSQADVVLISSAPADAFADAVVMAPVVDGVVLVVASGVTQEGALSEVGSALRAAKAKLLGAVLAGYDATAVDYRSYLPYKADSWRERTGLNGG